MIGKAFDHCASCLSYDPVHGGFSQLSLAPKLNSPLARQPRLPSLGLAFLLPSLVLRPVTSSTVSHTLLECLEARLHDNFGYVFRHYSVQMTGRFPVSKNDSMMMPSCLVAIVMLGCCHVNPIAWANVQV